MRFRIAAVLALTMAAAAAPLACADELRESRERAMDAVRSGQIRSLEEALDRLRAAYPGRVLRVELEEERVGAAAAPVWIYDFKLLTEGGRVLKIAMDAKTMEILKVEGQRRGVGE